MSFIDSSHITTVFLASNKKNTSTKVRTKKFRNLCSHNTYFESFTLLNPGNILLVFSNYLLSVREKFLH